MADLNSYLSTVGKILDVVGVAVIVFGIIISTYWLINHYSARMAGEEIYLNYRKDLARSILLGLEFLVAGDIIRSVATGFNIQSVIVLAVIVLIRSFLSITFEMEINGRWPWQKRQ
ncbi:DUF1622 domain-containing protein [Candidatus Saccharibacteria bacterium]|nr:DUF1622 domain-containing protein [Candidatus Saccharibacteria bacterium]